MEDLQRLYQTVILEHGKKPRNKGRIPAPDLAVTANNRLCGDRFDLTFSLTGDVISAAQFDGEGCAISTASASLMTELVTGKTVSQAKQLFTAFDAMMLGQDHDISGFETEMDQLQALATVRDFPNRMKCATLAWYGLDGALAGATEEVTTE